MGRPPTISESHFDTPPPEDEADELWAPHVSDPAAVDFKPVPSHTLAAFRGVATLSVITGSVINRIYPVHPPSHSAKRATLTELAAQLDHWFAELPDSLTFDPASSRSIPPPSVLLMHATYWSTVLLLHRAFIPKWKPTHRHTSNGTRESDTLAFKSFDICQSAASHMTSIMVAYKKQFGLSYGAVLSTHNLFAAGVMQVVTLTMRPSNVQTSIVLQQTLTCLKDMGVIWPSAYRAWGLIGGAKVQVDSNLLNPKIQRPKRHAEDAFGSEARSEASPLPRAYDLGPSAAGTNVAAPQASTTENRLLAHMLGIDFPLAGSATSYASDYEWWPRDQTKPHSPDSSRSAMSPSPKSGSNHSSPSAAMPIPFSFDQARIFWDPPVLQDMGANSFTDA